MEGMHDGLSSQSKLETAPSTSASEMSQMSSKVAQIVSHIHVQEQHRHMHLKKAPDVRAAHSAPHGAAKHVPGFSPEATRREDTRAISSIFGTSEQGNQRFEVHPDFPFMPASVPLMYTVAMASCLSHSPQERPSFTQLLSWLRDLEEEVATGTFVDSSGATQVHPSECLNLLYLCFAVAKSRDYVSTEKLVTSPLQL